MSFQEKVQLLFVGCMTLSFGIGFIMGAYFF